jgi:hypothetical protein
MKLIHKVIMVFVGVAKAWKKAIRMGLDGHTKIQSHNGTLWSHKRSLYNSDSEPPLGCNIKKARSK